MTQDRSYTSSDEYLLQENGCTTWAEMWERYQAGELEGVLHWVAKGANIPVIIQREMVRERIESAPESSSVSEVCRAIAEELGTSVSRVRSMYYHHG